MATITPTHNLVLTSKTNKHRRTLAGAAWTSPKGWLSIKLNPGVVITDSEDYYISLYPVKDVSAARTPEFEEREFTEDDIP